MCKKFARSYSERKYHLIGVHSMSSGNSDAATLMDPSAVKTHKKNQSSAVAKQRQKQKTIEASILSEPFDVIRGTAPAIMYKPGNYSQKVKASNWHKEVQSAMGSNGGSHRRRRNLETYAEAQKGMPPPHVYSHTQFCDKSLLPDNCQYIKPLANAEYRTDLTDCHDYGAVGNDDAFLLNICSEAVDLIRQKPEFQGPAICSMDETNGMAWNKELQALKDMHRLDSDSVASCLSNSSNPGESLRDPFECTLRAANLHEQSEGTHLQISAYYKHRDKVGNIVGLYTLKGCSYTFVAMQSSKYGEKSNREEAAILDTKYGSYKLYIRYKKHLSAEDHAKVHNFERDFMKCASALKLPRVRVYRLEAADMLIFTAADYLHASIIPVQEGGYPRSLLVFHQLIPT